MATGFSPRWRRLILAPLRPIALRSQVVILVMVAAGPAVVMLLSSAVEIRSSAIRQGRADALRMARALSEDHEERIQEARQLLVALGHVPAVRDQRRNECSELLAQMLLGYPAYTTLGVAGRDGELVCSAPMALAAVSLADRPIFRRAVESKRFVVGQYSVGRVTGRASIGLAQPIVDRRDLIAGVIYTALDLGHLNKTLGGSRLPPATTVTLIDRDGVVLARFPEPEGWLGRRLDDWHVARTALESGAQAVEAPDFDGHAVVYGLARLGGERTDGAVIVGLDRQTIVGPANRIFATTFALVLLVTLPFMALSWTGATALVVGPIQSLVRAARRLGAGELAARAPVEGTPELRELATSFNDMADALRRRTREAALAEERYRGHFERNLAGMFRTDRAGTIIDCNPAFATILGYASVDDVKGLEASRFFVDRRDGAHLLMHLTPGTSLMNRELQLQQRDGAAIWVLASIADVTGNGSPFLEGMIIDVTDRKRAERAERETEELLAMVQERQRIAEDLHDGIIQSIYATGLAIEECRRLIDGGRPNDARDRLQGTITMLDVIMRDIRNYVAGLHPQALRDLGLSRALFELGRDLELNALASVIVDAAPDVDGALPPQVARELFHIGREALANVVKHAPGAHAMLSLTRANGTVTLSVHDDGPGFDAARAASGRGLRNIAERARRAGGSIAVESGAGLGTRITVQVPVQEST